MAKIIFNNKNYNIDESALAPAMATLEAHLRSMAGGTDPVMLKAGLYETGAIALYEEQGADAIEGMMISSWDDLLANGIVHVDNGVVYSNFDEADTWENASSDALSGDLILPNDASITKLGDYREWYDENDEWFYEGRIAFGACYNLTGILIPNSVTSVDPYAFMNCENLTHVVVPNSITSICVCAFSGCSSLEHITLPDSITSIGDDAFSQCSSLTSITIPNSVTSIGMCAFKDCSSLTSITIPDRVTSIGDYAFCNCISLKSITIPDSVTSIGSYAFDCCSSLTSITIPDSVTSIGDYAFDHCKSLMSITFNGTIEQWNAIENGTLWNVWNAEVPATYVQCSNGQVSLLEE